MAKPKRIDPIKQREKRAKIAAAVGGVLFLIIAAIEIPPVLKSNSPPPSASSSSSSTSTTATSTTPTTTTAAVPSGGEFADTDVPPVATSGQLVSFSMFESKNPFKPQVLPGSTSTSSAQTSPSAGASGTNADKPGPDVPPTSTTTTPGATTTPSSVVPPAATTPAATTPAPPPTVTIKVNGSASHVAVQGAFPSANPVFRLVSYTSQTAQIGIVGGSYAAGGATLTLHLDQPVTLENQTDGKQYRLELVSTT